ncbi:conserved hypothetical protein [Vibrio parahaemolyticus]
MNDKPSVAVYKAIGIACGFVVSGTKKLVQQAYTPINLLIVSYALKTFRGEGEFAVNFFGNLWTLSAIETNRASTHGKKMTSNH